MSLPAYRAKQSTDTSGTGTIVLNAAAANARSFAAAFGISPRRVMYAISWQNGYEIGLGDFDGGTPGSLTRATVLLSSNSDALVTLPSGTKDVFAVFEPGAREIIGISTSTTLTLADLGNVVVFIGAASSFVLLPALATVPSGAGWLIINRGTAALTIDPSGAEQINGASSLVLNPGESAQIVRGGVWIAAVMIGANVIGNFSVGGDFLAGGGATIGAPLRIQPGSAALPALTPVGDVDTGIFYPSANTMAISLGGVEVARWEGSRFQQVGADGVTLQRVAGASYALRAQSAAGFGMVVEATNNTEASYQPLILGGSTVSFTTSGTARGGFTSGGDFQFNSGYGSVATAFGCRAWVNFNGTGTVAIRASGNVTSITDNGVGDYTVNFTNAMPDANYVVVGVGGMSSGPDLLPIGPKADVAPTTSSVRVIAKSVGQSAQDPLYANVAIFR